LIRIIIYKGKYFDKVLRFLIKILNFMKMNSVQENEIGKKSSQILPGWSPSGSPASESDQSEKNFEKFLNLKVYN
jgi:hypothetical protein